MEAKWKGHQCIRESWVFFLCYNKMKVKSFIAFCERPKNEPEINTGDNHDDDSCDNFKTA